MSARAILEKWSRDTIQHELWVGRDGAGAPVYASSVLRNAHIKRESEHIKDARGDDRLSEVQIYVATTDEFTIRDRITLADGSTPGILRIDRLADYQGSSWMVTIYL